MKGHLFTAIISAATVLGLQQISPQTQHIDQLEVNRLVVRDELIVSDTSAAWETGWEQQMIPRGIVARAGGHGNAGLWVRGRLIQSEIDDPFDQRFHSVNSDGQIHRAPGHISWNCWLDGAWRQMAIIQGEGVEYSEVAAEHWNGGNHPGRLRFQTFRPNHSEPLTDALLGQGKMSLGGGGYGGGGLPLPETVLDIWGGTTRSVPLDTPTAPRVIDHDGTQEHTYQLIAIGAQGNRSEPSPQVTSAGRATLHWDSIHGADTYIVVRDGTPITEPLRIEGAEKQWRDQMAN
jgi:hypothetical protein